MGHTYQNMQKQHKDFGKFGSEFTIVQPPLKNVPSLVFMFMAVSIAAFSFELYLIVTLIRRVKVHALFKFYVCITDQNLDVQILLLICIFLILVNAFRFQRKVYSESVLILPSLGLQVKTVYYLGTVKTHFIHISHIRDIVINEAVTMHSILHYLVVLLCNTKGDVTGMYPLFSHSWPSLSHLKDVYRSAQEKLIKPNRR